MISIVISQRAYSQMISQLELNLEVETGGILLGFTSDSKIFIVEAIDAGINAICNQGTFKFDKDYVEHVANVVSKIYLPVLSFVGVWHKHNHSNMPPFSEADKKMNQQAVELTKGMAVSLLFQKQIAKEYLLRAFCISTNTEEAELDFEISEIKCLKYVYETI